MNAIEVENYQDLDLEGCEYDDNHTVNTVSDYDSYNMAHITQSIGNIE